MESMQKTSKPKTQAYDTTAEVRRIEDGVAWVHIAGGVDETPVRLTINAKEGDTVQVRVSGGTAFLVGNGSAPPTDDTRANVAQTTAVNAQNTADTAIEDAERAKVAADSAQASADSAAASAASAQVSANNANEYASRALGGLSTVQSVAETLNWITQHGTMALTTDTALDPTHVYFVQDAQGDYVVGSTHYSIVTEPSADDLSTYYVLSIDESLQNYVGTHLAVTDEGLWVLPAATGYKVLIATGQGQTYTEAGTYIIDASGNTVARFGADVQIGKTGQSRLLEDFHSLQLVDKEGYTYLHISDLRDISGYAKITEFFVGDGTTTEFRVNFNIDSDASHDYSVTVDDVELTYETDYTITYYGAFEMVTAPIQDAKITIIYYTKDRAVKAYSLGERLSTGTIGAYSIAEGRDTTASGFGSHAEGYKTVASGKYSHAEGGNRTGSNSSMASGDYSHAEGCGALASGYNSHAEGMETVASGQRSHAEGCYTTASGDYSHAEGGKATLNEVGAVASGNYSHSEGYRTTASGSCAHAEGHTTEASGYLSHAQNQGTKASSAYQTAIGRYNEEDTNDKYAFIIGKGISDSVRHNALAVDWYGDIEIALNTSASSGTTDGYLYAAITALGWESEVIV